MKGSFTCPYCDTQNACNCKSCVEHIKDGEYVNKWTEDGEFHICGKCGKIYSPDQALDVEWKKIKNKS
jgi:transcription elongation factor Elf1